jgi:hypothetical protein
MGMKTLLTLLLIGLTTTVFAQQSRVWVAPSYLPKGAFQDSINAKRFREEQKKRKELLSFLQRNKAPINNSMPNALNMNTPPPVYDGNNDQGFDVYRSQIDNMPVLLPDSANAASLKIKTNPQIQLSTPVQPKRIPSTPKK